jgi:hypothetical protein
MSGDNIVQADRDYVAQVMVFYARRGKKDNSCTLSSSVVPRGEIQSESYLQPPSKQPHGGNFQDSKTYRCDVYVLETPKLARHHSQSQQYSCTYIFAIL